MRNNYTNTSRENKHTLNNTTTVESKTEVIYQRIVRHEKR